MVAVRPLPRAPLRAPWGRQGEVYRPAVARLLSRTLPPDLLVGVAAAAASTQAQSEREGAGVPHGLLLGSMAVALGADREVAARCGQVVDILAVAIDLADDVADVAEDVAAGRPPRGDGLDWAQRAALPALLCAAAVDALRWSFPEAPGAAPAASELVRLLAVLVRGQGRALEDSRRLEEVSAEEGRLLALPAWVEHGPGSVEARGAEALGRAWARTWQARRDLEERPGPEVVARWRSAWEAARAAWPEAPGFGPGEPFAFSVLVGAA